uniref:Leucine-rich repeat-containing N-terminal plant-type domain-containing protein n=1 Tax=Musa acuminata subsp. malaccensis TaxID=214687 RepID=A0A804JEX1_MUSAM
MDYCTSSTHPVPRHYSFGRWLTSILLFTAATTPTTKGCVEGERDALLDFKTGIVKDPSSSLSSWRGRVDCCRWSGVVCDNRTGHVVELNLQNSDPYNYETSIGGEIRPSLLLLTHLERLNLSYNDFGGIQIPKFLGSLTKLTYLDLSWSNFSGAIPPQLGNLSSLRYLDLNSGGLSTDGLHWLSRLTSLRYLDMSFGNLSMASHNWLQAVNMLSSLEELHLQYCGLTDLPSSLSHVNLTTLTTLDLFGNLFNSTIPNWLWKLHRLSYLDLSFSMFHGAIPAGIGNLTGLRELYLGVNSLSGPIPTEIGIWNSLKLIDLSGNSLFGPIPDGIKNLTRLRKLFLSYNSLSGPVPTEIGIWNSLKYIDLSNNSLFGPIPAGIGNLTGLEYIDLSGNLLFGTIPTEIGKLSNLIFLSLSSNSLEGTMSELHFANLTKLSELDVSENSLVISVGYDWIPPFQLQSIQLKSCKLGPAFPRWLRSQNSINDLGMSNTSIEDVLPDWFWNIPAFSINLSQNQINGTLPTFLEHMTNLSTLKLSMNLLEGPIPRLPPNLSYLYLYNNSFSGSLSSISLPLELELLDLSHNHISGSIPSFVCNLTQLRILDLSSNQISSEIPWCWQETNFIIYINLADNKLSGEIPSSIEKLTQLRSLHLNNNSLHGHLPSSLKNCSGLVFLDLGDNKFSGSIPTWIAQNFQNLEVLRLCSNMFSGNIPSELGQLHHLHIIDLANNNLSGPIPRSFGNLNATKTYRQRKLTSLGQHITYDALVKTRSALSNFDGTYDDSITLTIKGNSLIFSIIVYLVNIIDVSNNNLTGEIPVEIGSLSTLQTLNLSRNNLVGQIPATIGAMKSLETLDLSFNKLSGGIPQSLSDLYSLNHLNLSYNNLSGVIPSGNQLQTLNDASIYIGNAYLCGAPLTESCYSIKSNNVTKENNKDGSFMSSYYLSIILGYLVGLWSMFILMLFKKNWRVFYFQMVDKIYDKAYVAIKIRIASSTTD